ncbi:MAG TPA: hypothetical protein VF540_00760, partial [Segetibacter sp.]
LTTSLGAKAIVGAVNGEHLLICDEPEDYAAAIAQLHKDKKSMMTMGIKAKNLMKESFTWDLYAKKFYEVLDVGNQIDRAMDNRTA